LAKVEVTGSSASTAINETHRTAKPIVTRHRNASGTDRVDRRFSSTLLTTSRNKFTQRRHQ